MHQITAAVSDHVHSVTKRDAAVRRYQRHRRGPHAASGFDTGERGNLFNTQRASIHSHVINQSGKIDFITSLITRTNLQLLCVSMDWPFNEERLY